MTVTVPNRIPPGPLDCRDCAPILYVVDGRENRFKLAHELGYIWNAESRTWFIPETPGPWRPITFVTAPSHASDASSTNP